MISQDYTRPVRLPMLCGYDLVFSVMYSDVLKGQSQGLQFDLVKNRYGPEPKTFEIRRSWSEHKP